MKSVKVPALELFLHEMIPLAKAMGVGVEVSDDRSLTLTAPKEQNKNSLNTAFGGSLVSLATLAGYGVVWELMKNEKGADDRRPRRWERAGGVAEGNGSAPVALHVDVAATAA